MSMAFQVPLGHCTIIIIVGVQWDSFPVPAPSGKAIFALRKNSFFFKRPVAVFISNGGRRKADRKGTSAGLIS